SAAPELSAPALHDALPIYLGLRFQFRIQSRLLPRHQTARHDAGDPDLGDGGVGAYAVRLADAPWIALGQRHRVLDLQAHERVRIPVPLLLEHAAQLEPAAVALVVVAMVVAVPEDGEAVGQVAPDPAVLGCRGALCTDGDRRPSPRRARLAPTRELAALEAVLGPAAQHWLDRADRRREHTRADTECKAVD